jgi:hypothetical protein
MKDMSFYHKKTYHDNMSKAKTGSKNGRWKGGINHQGYVIVFSPHHPFAGAGGNVFEHRLVMEKYIKRFLLPTEIVHHINEIRHDNRIEDLQLLANRGEHNKIHFT